HGFVSWFRGHPVLAAGSVEPAVALLVLLAAAAGAGIVAADLGPLAHDPLRGRGQHSLALGGQGLGLLGLLVGTVATGLGMLELHAPGLRLLALTLGGLHGGHLLLAADAHPRQQ